MLSRQLWQPMLPFSGNVTFDCGGGAAESWYGVATIGRLF